MNSDILKSIIENIDKSIHVMIYYNLNKLTIEDDDNIFKNKILSELIKADIQMTIDIYDRLIELVIESEYVNVFYNELMNIKEKR